MTRESLAKDILLAFIPRWAEIVEGVPPTANPFKAVASSCVELADALLEALGTTEPPASWLSKEMQTPAKGFPALRTIEPGVSVVVCANGDPRLAPWDGRFGVVVEKFNTAGLWSVNIGEVGKTLVAPSCHLEVRG